MKPGRPLEYRYHQLSVFTCETHIPMDGRRFSLGRISSAAISGNEISHSKQGNRIWKNFIETAPGNAEPQLGTLLSTVHLGD